MEPTIVWHTFFFLFFAILACVFGVAVVVTSNIVRMAFWLLGTLTGVAGLYLLLGADFLGLTQIFVYVGGINVLLLFGIMLTNRDPIFVRKLATRPRLAPALILGIIVLMGLLEALGSTRWHVEPGEYQETARGLGTFLLSEYVLPFEIVSILLLVVLVGAAYVARRDVGKGAAR